MSESGSSFFLPGSDYKSDYKFFRDNERDGDVREAMEVMWKAYQPYCPEHDFRTKATDDIYAAAWHLHLASILLHHNFELVKTDGVGPDLCVVFQDKRIWIEAVSVNSGNGPDAVRVAPSGVSGLPTREILLRVRNGFEEKARQHQRWLSKPEVINDPYVIAINYGLVPMGDIGYGISNIERMLFGLGDFYWTVNPETGETMAGGYKQQTSISKRSGSPVSTNCFRDATYARISAVMDTPQHILNSWNRWGRDITLCHNPFARVPLNKRCFGFGQERWVEEDNLVRIDHREPIPTEETIYDDIVPVEGPWEMENFED